MIILRPVLCGPAKADFRRTTSYAPEDNMHRDQYTADAITHSMGLGPFVDPAWDTSKYSLRLVLKPSFHSEFFLDIRTVDSRTQIIAVCLSEMLWHQKSPQRLPAFHERKLMGRSESDRIQSLCSTINRDAEQPICLDGMGLNAAWTNNGEWVRFDSYVYGETVTCFVATVLEIAWNIFKTPGIRNGIANCGQYVGLKYPLEPEPPKPPQLLVLGNADDVADYFKLLREHRAAGGPGS